MWWHRPAISAQGKLRQEDDHEFKVSLRYTVSSSLVWTTQWDPILKNQNKKITSPGLLRLPPNFKTVDPSTIPIFYLFLTLLCSTLGASWGCDREACFFGLDFPGGSAMRLTLLGGGWVSHLKSGSFLPPRSSDYTADFLIWNAKRMI